MRLEGYPFIHAFHLDTGALETVPLEENALPQRGAWKRIRDTLIEKGYAVYASNCVAHGLPADFLLTKEWYAGDALPDFKNDLASIAKEMRAPYLSGDFYMRHLPVRTCALSMQAELQTI